MTKATEMFSLLAAIAVVYTLLLLKIIPTGQLIHDEILPVLPWWGLVTLGAYALGSLGYDVLTFKDKKEKYEELMEEIKEAKVELKKKGVTVSE